MIAAPNAEGLSRVNAGFDRDWGAASTTSSASSAVAIPGTPIGAAQWRRWRWSGARAPRGLNGG